MCVFVRTRVNVRECACVISGEWHLDVAVWRYVRRLHSGSFCGYSHEQELFVCLFVHQKQCSTAAIHIDGLETLKHLSNESLEVNLQKRAFM